MIIKSTDLIKMLNLISERIKADNIEEYNIDVDYYWKVIPEDSTKMEEVPSLAVGSLIDDWENISKVIHNKELLMWVDYERIASVLIFVSEELVK